VLLAISRSGEAGGSEKRAVVAVQGRGRELLRNAGKIQNGRRRQRKQKKA
jgi:hypothetical protein